jgi:hypothetical protein
MSQHSGSFPPKIDSGDLPARGNGIAIASLVLGIVGLVIAPLALVGLILGIIAVNRSSEGRRGGMAIAGLILSACGLVFGCLSIGIVLPALGKARIAARQIKSSTQIRGIAQGLILYANDNKDQFPEPGADWETRLVSAGLVSRELLVAPQAQPGDLSYFYVPGGASTFDHKRVLVIENPEFYRGLGANIAFGDSTVQYLTGDEYWQVVDKVKAGGVQVPFTRRR